MTLTAGANAVPGTSTVTVRASGAGIADKTVTVQFTVTSAATPDFTLTAAPAALTVAPGGSGQSVITLTRSGGFAGTVAFTTSTLPAGVTATLTPNPATANTSTVVLATAAATAPGTYTITITGTATGVTARTVNIVLTVSAAPGFSVAFATNSVTVPAGGTASLTATLARTGGFADAVNLAVTGLPSGITATVNPAAATGATATVNIAAAASVPAGSYTGSLNATASGLPGTATPFTVTVTATGGGSGGAGRSIQWQFCNASQVPLFLAVRSGTTGAWTPVTPTGNTFSFTLTQSVGGVAYVSPSGSGFETTVLLETAAELAASAALDCAVFPPSVKTLTGTVAGLGAQQSAEISMGYASDLVDSRQSTYTLIQLPNGPLDLVGVRRTIDPATFVPIPDKFIIRRGLDQATGSTIAPLDFNSVEAFARAVAKVTIGNLGGDRPIVGSIFNTANGTSVETGSELPQGTAATQPVSIYGVPTARLAPGDLHEVAITTFPAENGAVRMVSAFFRDFGDKTLNLGAPLAAPSITTSGGTAPRPRATGAIPTDYQELIELEFSQDAAKRTATINATKGYLGASTQYDLEVPDLSGLAGYNPAWSFTSGAAMTYSFSANNLLSAEPRDGDVWRTAYRTGTVPLAALRRSLNGLRAPAPQLRMTRGR